MHLRIILPSKQRNQSANVVFKHVLKRCTIIQSSYEGGGAERFCSFQSSQERGSVTLVTAKDWFVFSAWGLSPTGDPVKTLFH